MQVAKAKRSSNQEKGRRRKGEEVLLKGQGEVEVISATVDGGAEQVVCCGKTAN